MYYFSLGDRSGISRGSIGALSGISRGSLGDRSGSRMFSSFFSVLRPSFPSLWLLLSTSSSVFFISFLFGPSFLSFLLLHTHAREPARTHARTHAHKHTLLTSYVRSKLLLKVESADGARGCFKVWYLQFAAQRPVCIFITHAACGPKNITAHLICAPLWWVKKPLIAPLSVRTSPVAKPGVTAARLTGALLHQAVYLTLSTRDSSLCL